MKDLYDKVLIIDYGSQFTQLISRRIRELKIYNEIFPNFISEKEIKKFAPKAIILSGGSQSVIFKNSPKIPKIIYNMDVPILGICYGYQALAKDFEAEIVSDISRGYGDSELLILQESKLFEQCWKINEKYKVWMSHGDTIKTVPNDFNVIASTEKAPFAAIEHKYKKIYGLQFHPEVSHTIQGKKILKNFLVNISKCKQNWKIKKFTENLINEIKKEVKEDKVVLGFSGGVDSTVLAVLLNKAIGKQLYCVFVNNGLLRQEETEEVKLNMEKLFNLKLLTVDASQKFLNELSGIEDPEKKRKIIGRVFIETFQKTIKNLGDVKYLAQGTIYPDVIESLSTNSGEKVTIKSHHNVGGLPDNLGKLKLLEPLKLLFKDEIRKLGKELKIPNNLLYRHPFPGPGLGIRILGEVTAEKCELLKKADHIFISILKEKNLYHKIWQAYAALLPVKTVGVMGDNRTYQYICVLRAVISTDGMTANAAKLPHSILSMIAKNIIESVDGINRVLYDVTSKPPGTIEME